MTLNVLSPMVVRAPGGHGRCGEIQRAPGGVENATVVLSTIKNATVVHSRTRKSKQIDILHARTLLRSSNFSKESETGSLKVGLRVNVCGVKVGGAGLFSEVGGANGISRSPVS